MAQLIAQAYGASLAVAIFFMTAGFLYAKQQRRVDFVDVLWGQVFILVAVTAFVVARPQTLAPVAVLTMIGLWGLRLSLHIGRRYRRASVQDERYTDLIARWPAGHKWLRVFLKIYLLQALLAVLISTPVILIMAGEMAGPEWLIGGLTVWLLGFVTEVHADSQLKAFVMNPKHKGKLMTEGLWKYSRHPNYFGEMLQWWGIWSISLGTGYGLYTVIGPMLITWLLLFVSGVPIAEKRAARKPGWETYKSQTNMILPWPPKK